MNRNYFGTLLTLLVPLPWMFPCTLRFLTSLPTLWTYLLALNLPATLHFLYAQNFLVAWCFAVLAVSLGKRSWFESGTKGKPWLLFAPLMLVAGHHVLIEYPLMIKAFEGALKNNHWQSLSPHAQRLLEALLIYYLPYSSMRAKSDTVRGRLFQAFVGEGVKGSALGSLITIATIILPNLFALYYLIGIEGVKWQLMKTEQLSKGLALVISSLILCLWSLSVYSEISVKAEVDRPFVRGLSAVLAPLLFTLTCSHLNLLQRKGHVLLGQRVDWMVIIFCGWYLIGGVGGYVGYVMPRSSWIGRLFHPFITDDDEVDVKDVSNCSDTCASDSGDTCADASTSGDTQSNDSVIQIEGNTSNSE